MGCRSFRLQFLIDLFCPCRYNQWSEILIAPPEHSVHFARTPKLATAMPQDKLKNPPLVEVVFEIQWDSQLARRNPFFSICWGQLHSGLSEKFLRIVPLLPAIPLPEEISHNMYHYRFCPQGKTSPMVQVGPGALALHETNPLSYCWEEFKENIRFISKQLIQNPANIFLPRRLALRYIDFFECNFAEIGFFDYLKKYLKIDFSLPSKLFDRGYVYSQASPHNLHLQTFFPCCSSKGGDLGEVGLSFRCGERHRGKDKVLGIFMETIVQCPPMPFEKMSRCWSPPEEVTNWAEEAHNITHRWFFTLIDGGLREKFDQ